MLLAQYKGHSSIYCLVIQTVALYNFFQLQCQQFKPWYCVWATIHTTPVTRTLNVYLIFIPEIMWDISVFWFILFQMSLSTYFWYPNYGSQKITRQWAFKFNWYWIFYIYSNIWLLIAIIVLFKYFSYLMIPACEEGPGLCALAMTVLSLFFIIITLPLSMLFVVKVVQEYERAVIFRLGRLLTGGARGPGVFFVIPCVDVYEKIDMRSQTFEIPPQEVRYCLL